MIADGGPQRVRSLRRSQPEPEPNVIIVSQPRANVRALGDLRDNLELAYLGTLGGEAGDIGLIEAHVGEGDMVEVGKFYDRQDSTLNWYYQCYGVDQTQKVGDYVIENTRETSSVSSWLGLTGWQGSIVIVKNGPAGGAWKEDLGIQLDSLVRSIWWYMRSGNDRAQVFGERELSRFILGL